ncbi:MAG: aldolase [Gammaproteobacteria bacterium]|nr:aldolase [Gammaproteobacteria bacterium]
MVNATISAPLVNHAKQKLARNELVLCLAVNQMRSPDIALIAASCGFDAIFIDMEHGPTALESASAVSVAALGFGVTPIARIASHHAHDMARYLDSGGMGLMVPHVDDAEQAEAIVRYCKFPPRGMRSAPGTIPGLRFESLPQPEVNRILDEQVLLAAMIETPTGLANIDAIAAVDGIDLIHIGALDLSTVMGLAPGDMHHPAMQAAFETVAAACHKHGKAMGVGGARGDRALQQRLVDLGVRYLTLGSDFGYLMAAARPDVSAVRAMLPGT